ncbi:MAG TPA: tetratricopeptide repeat protein [Casimicrobiaceae bacterium]|nr:tetratricopeptide repeat protein [Casimicrobiaceae bacterium]
MTGGDGNPAARALASFLKMLDAGKDSALLRYSLGNEYVKIHDTERAVPHLRRAVELDPEYTAAWKLLGRALAEAGQTTDALAAYAAGIDVAGRRGDKQALKEMQVFSRRLRKS